MPMCGLFQVNYAVLWDCGKASPGSLENVLRQEAMHVPKSCETYLSAGGLLLLRHQHADIGDMCDMHTWQLHSLQSCCCHLHYMRALPALPDMQLSCDSLDDHAGTA